MSLCEIIWVFDHDKKICRKVDQTSGAIRMSEHDSKNHETDSLGPRSGYHSRLTESVSQCVRSENLSF